MAYVNLHRHDTFSLFDGYGTAKQAARHAADMGQPALGLTNHGNVCGLVEHYKACKEFGIKPILGCEVYFQPRFDPARARYHLTVLCETTEGYHNLCRMLTYANQHQFYSVPIVDFPLLERYGKGLILLSGCLAGYLPKVIMASIKAREGIASYDMETFADIVDRFKQLPCRYYLEIQPIDTEDGAQRIVNDVLLRLSARVAIPCILTTDSHYSRKSDYPTYQNMYKLANRKMYGGYEQRFMPSESEIVSMWGGMGITRASHQHVPPISTLTNYTVALADSCDVSLEFKEMIPNMGWKDSKKALTKAIVDGLRGKVPDGLTDEYAERAARELKVITGKGFTDYFLLCRSIVEEAKSRGIQTSFGRGSVCGSLVAYALGLTRVDPIHLGTSFERFLRPDKNVTPDIDLDFDAGRRDEVLSWLQTRFDGQSARIATFIYYRAKNLWNDLCKLYEVDEQAATHGKAVLEMLTAGDQAGEKVTLDEQAILNEPELLYIKNKYPGILRDFVGLYGQIRAIGEHAAGIAITADEISKYAAIMRVGSKDKIRFITSYDMQSITAINVLKVDILGLETMAIIHDLESVGGRHFSYDLLEDEDIIAGFRDADTDAIFQFERPGVKKMLVESEPTSFDDVVAINALNRPGTLPAFDAFVEGKGGNVDTTTPWYQFTKDTYGALIYQEQVMAICRAAGLEWSETDKVMKSVNLKKVDPTLLKKFVECASEAFGITKRQASDLYRRSTLYLFNKNHATGYTLIAWYLMYWKKHHPLLFWWATLRHEAQEFKRAAYMAAAAREGIAFLPPHVNAGSDYRIEQFDGDDVLRIGLSTIKGVGPKVAAEIARDVEKHGPFASDDEFFGRIPKRIRNTKVVAALDSVGALCFDDAANLESALKFNQRLLRSRAEVR